MYIPITLYEGKSAEQHSYGFYILKKLESYPTDFQNHEGRATFFKIDPHNDGPRRYF